MVLNTRLDFKETQMEILLVLLVVGGVLYYAYRQVNRQDQPVQHSDVTTTTTLAPMPDTQSSTAILGPKEETMIDNVKLPEDWASYNPTQKIDFFNANSITEEVLKSQGVSDSDIAWMRNNGYTVGLPVQTEEPVVEETKPKRKTTRKTAAEPAVKPAARKSVVRKAKQ